MLCARNISATYKLHIKGKGLPSKCNCYRCVYVQAYGHLTQVTKTE